MPGPNRRPTCPHHPYPRLREIMPTRLRSLQLPKSKSAAAREADWQHSFSSMVGWYICCQGHQLAVPSMNEGKQMQTTTMADTCLKDQLATGERRAHVRVLIPSSAPMPATCGGVLHRVAVSLEIAYESRIERKRQTEHTSSHSESSVDAIPTALVR